jgi:hypothetical protein
LSHHPQALSSSTVSLSPKNKIYKQEDLQLQFLNLRISQILHSSLVVATKLPQINVSHFSVLLAIDEHNPVPA